VDWCVRARRAGLGLTVVLGARVRHAGARTLGPASPDRLYYAARNHLAAVERLHPLRGWARWARLARVIGRNLTHALLQRDVPRASALAAVAHGALDFRRGCLGPRLG
jgi:GT2 family glycosyltransferase